MKRISALVLAAALCFGGVSTANADGVDMKVKGQWDFAFGWVNNGVFKKLINDSDGTGARKTKDQEGKRMDADQFEARQRIRTQVNFISSEYLQGVLMFEIGDIDWGRNGKDGATHGRSSGGALDTDGVNIETKLAYLDWVIPQTDVSIRMGLQRLALPSTRLKNPILDADVAGIAANSPITDWLGATLFWARPLDRYRHDGLKSLSDATDAFGLILPVNIDGFNIAPYFVYSRVGGNSGFAEYHWGTNGNAYVDDRTHANAWWAGANFTMDLLDPLVFSLDGAYGHMGKLENTDVFGDYDRGTVKAAGWFMAATLDYKMDFGTPGIFGWYGSGDKSRAAQDGRMGRMPILGNDGGNFRPTSFGTAGYSGVGNGANDTKVIGNPMGSWGIGIQVADMSFIEDLSHTLRFAYYQGTNSRELARDGSFLVRNDDNMYLTRDDKVFEVNFDHKYQIYENLTAVLELGWLHVKSDEKAWGSADNGLKDKDNAWKAEVNFQYRF